MTTKDTRLFLASSACALAGAAVSLVVAMTYGAEVEAQRRSGDGTSFFTEFARDKAGWLLAG